MWESFQFRYFEPLTVSLCYSQKSMGIRLTMDPENSRLQRIL